MRGKSPSNGDVFWTFLLKARSKGIQYDTSTIQGRLIALWKEGCNTVQGNNIGPFAGILHTFQRYFTYWFCVNQKNSIPGMHTHYEECGTNSKHTEYCAGDLSLFVEFFWIPRLEKNDFRNSTIHVDNVLVCCNSSCRHIKQFPVQTCGFIMGIASSPTSLDSWTTRSGNQTLAMRDHQIWKFVEKNRETFQRCPWLIWAKRCHLHPFASICTTTPSPLIPLLP